LKKVINKKTPAKKAAVKKAPAKKAAAKKAPAKKAAVKKVIAKKTPAKKLKKQDKYEEAQFLASIKPYVLKKNEKYMNV
jgi:hypothetical protein